MIFGYSFKPAVQTVKWIGHLLVHPVRASLTFRVHSMTNALPIHAFCSSRVLLQPPMSKQTLVVGGIALNVFSLSGADTQNTERPEAAGKKPIAVLFLLHGRGGDADQIELVAKAILDEVQSKRKDAVGKGASAEEETHDLWIVTFVSVMLRFWGVRDWRGSKKVCRRGHGIIMLNMGIPAGPSEPRVAVGRSAGERCLER